MKIKVFTYLLLILFFSACTENFEDFNTDKKNPASVPGEALFSNAVKDLTDQLNRPNVNWNIFELWCQYWNETTYTDEANYDISQRDQPEGVFRACYRRTLRDLDEAAKIISEGTTANAEEEKMKANKLHIIEIINVFTYQYLVDVFGAVPYSEALDIGNVYPRYEMGADIYDDLLTRLDAAISGLDASVGSFGSADLVYRGNVAAWKRFGNSLKVKIGINLADVSSSKAQSAIESAVSSGVFTSASDEALLPYQSSAPNYNQIYADLVASGRNDFVAANTIIDIMVNRNDPRLPYYFNSATVRPMQVDGDSTYEDGNNEILFFRQPDGSYTSEFREGPFTITAAEADAGVWIWRGGTYGVGTPWATHTQVADAILEPTFPGLIMTYSEVMFYLAEAAARGYSVGMTEEEAYNAAITESILWWGGSQDDADAYLANPDVAYATAEGDWKRKIATQSWIASYLNGFLGYTTWRRLDWPVLNISPDAASFPAAATDVTKIPVRFTFPTNEQTLNEAQWEAASSAIGGDNMTNKIFWDLYDANDGN